MKTKLRLLTALVAFPLLDSSLPAQDCEEGEYLGRLSVNPFLSDSTANPFGKFGSPYEANSISNPYGEFGSPYSGGSVSNRYATDALKIIAADGQYLGRLTANPYEADSVSNPYGQYGSPYSPTSINNPYSQYGSPYSPMSPNNPYATKPPILCEDLE